MKNCLTIHNLLRYIYNNKREGNFMAKKKSTGGLVMKIITIVAAVLTFVSIAFKFVGYTVRATLGSLTNSESDSSSMGDWFDMLENASTEADDIAAWQAAKGFLIAAFIIIGIIAVIAILKLFMNMGLLNLLMKIAGIAGIVVSLVFIICLIVGCVQMSGSLTDAITCSYYPREGSILITLFGLIASGCAMKVAKS